MIPRLDREDRGNIMDWGSDLTGVHMDGALHGHNHDMLDICTA